MKDRIKIQHYVPRFYLRNFSIRQERKYVTNCFDKNKGKSFPVNIKGVAAEKYFYDASKYRNQIIEKSLGRLESMFNTAYNEIIRNGNLTVLSKKEKMSFACFIATQEIRTREFRELIKDLLRQLTKKLSKKKLSKELEKQLKEAGTDKFIRSLQLKILMKSIPELASILFRMKWVLLINRTNLSYWTSDHPVNRYNTIDLGPYGNMGLLSPGIQVYCPLTSYVSLGVFDPIVYRYFPEKYEITDKQNIVFLNHLQVKSSTRHLFSIDRDFSLAKKMIKDIPDLKDINRKRVVIY